MQAANKVQLQNACVCVLRGWELLDSFGQNQGASLLSDGVRCGYVEISYTVWVWQAPLGALSSPVG
jgi:hypothetical protein